MTYTVTLFGYTVYSNKKLRMS